MPDNPDDQARLFYLIVLGLGLAFVSLFGGRRRLARGLRDFMVWAMIFVMVVIAYGFRDTLRSALFPAAMVQVDGQTIELRRGSDGHFHAVLDVNGEPVNFIIDTGASDIVLGAGDAARVGIDRDALSFIGRATTANGTVSTAPVRLARVRFGELVDTDVRASVSSGALDLSLLGMAYLDRFSRIEIEGDRMVLRR